MARPFYNFFSWSSSSIPADPLTVVDVQEQHSALFHYIKSVMSMLMSFLASGLKGHSIKFFLQNQMLVFLAILADLSLSIPWPSLYPETRQC